MPAGVLTILLDYTILGSRLRQEDGFQLGTNLGELSYRSSNTNEFLSVATVPVYIPSQIVVTCFMIKSSLQKYFSHYNCKILSHPIRLGF